MSNANVAQYLFFKVTEEAGEAIQAIMKMCQKGPNGKWDDKKTNLEHVTEELSHISTLIAFLLDSELIDNRRFWKEHDVKSEKWGKIIMSLVEEKKNNNDSDERDSDSDGQSTDSGQ